MIQHPESLGAYTCPFLSSQEVLRPKEERHCEFCHVTHEHTAISVEAWEQHLRQCEEKVQAGDPDWPRFAPLERPPPRIQKLKAELMDVEVMKPRS